MRILHLEAGRHFYGGARQVSYLVNELSRRGIDNTVLCCPGHALTETITGAEVIEMPLAGDLDLTLPTRLARILATRRADLLHVHSRRGADLYGGIAAARAEISSVLTRRVQSREPRAWIRLKCRPYRNIVAISSTVEDELVAAGIESSRVVRIPSAVDTDLFRPDPEARARLLRRYDLPADAVIAGVAAQFVPRKGHDVLLPLIAELMRERPDFRLLLFGQGPTRAATERRVVRLGLADAIHFCGFATDWPSLLPGLDLLLHPARREGLGVAVLEAMSAGVPVIAARAGGLPDLIPSAATGSLVPGDSVAAWHEAIDSLLADAGRCERIAATARQRVREQFTIAAMTDRYLELYRQPRRD